MKTLNSLYSVGGSLVGLLLLVVKYMSAKVCALRAKLNPSLLNFTVSASTRTSFSPSEITGILRYLVWGSPRISSLVWKNYGFELVCT